VTAPGPPAARDEPTSTEASDPYLWLEDVTGDRALDWVRARNAEAEATLAGTAEFRQLESRLLEILDSDARIPVVEKKGDLCYNFWRDARHERGIWRRTTLASYRTEQPEWETVIDLDALNRIEGENWVWHGATFLEPDRDRCLVALSRGGADADVTREFDLITRSWVEDGFHRPEAKGALAWIDRDKVYVYTDFGPGTTSSSGYPLIVKEWRRGTPMSDARLVYEGQSTDMYIAANRDHSPGYERDFVSRTLTFYSDQLHLRALDGTLVRVDVPDSANKSVHRQWLTVELREPWTVGDTTYPGGSLLATRFDDYMAGGRELHVLFTPTHTTSLASYTWTLDQLVLNVLDDVRNRLVVLTPTASGWQRDPFVGAPALGTVEVSAVDADRSNEVWLTSTGYLTPTTLALAEPGREPEVLKKLPEFFDASALVVEQHFTTSEDGTRVPYFMVCPTDLELDGTAPTLLYGYGGFEVSLTPGYSAGVGKGWLERGGVFVVANIRGGGEYGPRWHQAALRANRHRAYEDFASVARDLIARRVTSASRLGVQGGSNGGLLAGNMLTQYPELSGAVVIQVPLLDMKRYSHLLAGASWVAEYGDPDTEDWEFIRTFSPYHLLDPTRAYPPVLFTTSTRDDRVHPAHARKMAALMLDAGMRVDYYENIEGGHGGAASNAQAAHMSALAYAFLWRELGRS